MACTFLRLPTEYAIQFLTSSSTCVASIVRVQYLSRVGYLDSTCMFTAHLRPEYCIDEAIGSNIDAVIWSTVEPCAGIVSACLPVMRPLLQKLVPDWASSINQESMSDVSSRMANHLQTIALGYTHDVCGGLDQMGPLNVQNPAKFRRICWRICWRSSLQAIRKLPNLMMTRSRLLKSARLLASDASIRCYLLFNS